MSKLQIFKDKATMRPCQYARFLAIAPRRGQVKYIWVGHSLKQVFLCMYCCPVSKTSSTRTNKTPCKGYRIDRFSYNLHCCKNLFNAVVSNAENSLAAASTASPSLMASFLLCASMLRGRTGSWRDNLNRNQPPYPETLTPS